VRLSQHLSGVAHEGHEDRELDAAEENQFAPLKEAATVGVQLEVAESIDDGAAHA
jgi:hypothetical protein